MRYHGIDQTTSALQILDARRMLKNWPGVKIFTLIPTLSFGAKPVLTACGFVCVCSSYVLRGNQKRGEIF
jgi:hypothetical protein